MSTVDERFARLEQANIGLRERLQSTERAYRRLRRVLVVTMLGLAVGLVAGAKLADAPKTVEAERFLVRDKDGKIRATLGYSAGDVSDLRLYDREGKVRVKVAVTDSSDQGDLFEGKGRLRDGAGVQLYDEKGKVRAEMVMTPSNVLQFDIMDNEENLRFALAVDGEEEGLVQMGISGKQSSGFELFGEANGAVNMNFLDHERKSRLHLAVLPDGGQQIVTWDKQENPRFKLEAKPDGSASLRILDKGGKTLFEAPKP